MLSKAQGKGARGADRPKKAACSVEPTHLSGLTDASGGDTIYLSVVDRDGNIVSLIQSLYSGFGSGVVAPGTGVMLHNRGGLFTLEDGHPNQIAPRKRPLHTIIPGFMEKDDVRIGFGIMGGFNQAQAHAQFVSDVVDFGSMCSRRWRSDGSRSSRSRAVTWTSKRSFPRRRAQSWRRWGTSGTIAPRSSTFGYGQAVMTDGAGVHFAGSEPRHDGAAIPKRHQCSSESDSSRLLSLEHPRHLLLPFLAADGRLERSVRSRLIAMTFGKSRRVFERHRLSVEMRQPEFGRRLPVGLGDVEEASVALDDPEVLEFDEPIASDRA
jgi:hypothetical protein